MNNALAFAMDTINKGNEIIMNWFYDNTQPEERIEDIPEGTKKEILKECIKWYGEMGEYWVDDPARISKNIAWADELINKIISYKENA